MFYLREGNLPFNCHNEPEGVLATNIKSHARWGNPAYKDLQKQFTKHHGITARDQECCGSARIGKPGFNLKAFDRKRRYKAGKPAVVAPNLLQQNFEVQAPDRAWVTYITYFKCKSRWAYFAAIMDLYSRKTVGWYEVEKMTTDLVIKAIQRAGWRPRPRKQVTIHSDQDCQYGSDGWVNFLKTKHEQER